MIAKELVLEEIAPIPLLENLDNLPNLLRLFAIADQQCVIGIYNDQIVHTYAGYQPFL